jgi:hypothetical protein
MVFSDISTVIAALSVLVGVVFAVFQMRDAAKARHTELIIELNPALKVGVDDISEALPKIWSLDYTDYADYLRKYGDPVGDKSYYAITEYYNGLGFLLHRGLVDLDEIEYLLSGTVSETWEKVQPVVEGMRRQHNIPDLCEWFEYLYERMRQREGSEETVRMS